MTVAELRKMRAEILAKARKVADLDAPNAEDTKAFDGFMAEADGVAERITRIERIEGLERSLGTVDPPVARPSPDAPKAKRPGVIENPGFENIGELIYCARFERGDSRIRALMEQSTGSSGGIMVPTQFVESLQSIAPSAAVVRPRATVIGAGEKPDEELELPALNQGSGKNMFGGASVAWTAEGGSVGETQGHLKSVKWNPKEVTAKTTVTDKLLRNWRAAGPFIEQILRGAMDAAEDVAFLTGNGGNQPRGVITAPASKTRARAGAGAISYADLVAMEAKFHEDMPGVWIASPTAIAALRTIVDAGNHYIWTEGNPSTGGGVATQAQPAMILGRPVIRSFRTPALGTKGDLILADLKKYIVKDGLQLQIAASEHVYFETNKTVIKAVKSVDGAPWLDGPIVQENAGTYSPFVVLADNGSAEV